MSDERTADTPKKSRLAPVAWLIVGFVLAGVVFVDPFGVLPFDDWLRERVAMAGSSMEEVPEGTLWTCGMHPNVIQEEPGACPICGMDLVPLRDGTGASAADHAGHDHGMAADGSRAMAAVTKWVCADFPDQVFDEPGDCPIDGTPLVEKEQEGGMAGTMSGEREILFYRNPMDPNITSPEPRQDEMGMAYVPVYSDEVDGESMGAPGSMSSGPVVSIDPVTVQNMNVQTVMVERRNVSREIRTVGYLEYDQQKMVSVTTKYSGFVEKVHVNYVGEPVRKGQPLFEIYSPELVQTEQELLSALDYARRMENASPDARRRAQSLVEAARQRLSYWDIMPEQVAHLEETGQVNRTLAVTAPSSGVVMMRMSGLEGMAAKPGMELFHIADLSSLWLSVEVFEDQLAWVREGSEADVTFSYFPGEHFTGKVRYIEPEVSEKTRTVSLRLEVPNRSRKLKSGMYATVVFRPMAAEAAVAVPNQAVLRTGERNVVIVALGEGRFAPREVTLGASGEGYVQVLDGLRAGERIVTSSQFLIDSESNLKAAIQKMVEERRRRRGDGASSMPGPMSGEPPDEMDDDGAAESMGHQGTIEASPRDDESASHQGVGASPSHLEGGKGIEGMGGDPVDRQGRTERRHRRIGNPRSVGTKSGLPGVHEARPC